jgi:5-methylcytosine-specific restriction endonuclease McrBC regulatory subunit McrC
MAEYLLDVSPRGKTAGLLLAAGASGSFGMVVLPKPWRDGPPQARILEWGGGEVVIRCYEGDQVVVRTPGPLVETVLQGVLNNSGGREVGGLIAPGSFSDRHVRTEAVPASGRDFAALAGLARMWQERVRRGTAAGLLPHGPIGSPLLRPLLYADFLTEVVGRLRALRRGYEERSEPVLGIKGRPDERSLQRVLTQRSLRVECRFEEFTHQTPLARTLATALDVIVGDRGVVGWLLRASGLPDPSERAVQARRLLFDVAPYPRAEALHVARTLNLGRLDAAWVNALALARRVLTPTGEESSLDSASTALRTVSLPTEKIWEDLVYESFVEALGPTRVQNLNVSSTGHLATVRRPWVTEGRPLAPDVVAHADGDLHLIVDAKYKEPGSTPAIDDQYQLFAYSHLVRFGTAGPSYCVLAYPDYGPTSTLIDAPRAGGGPSPPRLRAVRVPFPSARDVQDSAAWFDFVHRASAAVREFLQDLT